MLSVFIFHDCKTNRTCNTIICTQSSAFCFNPITIYNKKNRICQKVVFNAVSFFCDHIHVTLNYNSRMIHIIRMSWFSDYNVVAFVLYSFKSQFFSSLVQKVTDCLFISRFSRNFSQFFEIMKHSFRF